MRFTLVASSSLRLKSEAQGRDLAQDLPFIAQCGSSVIDDLPDFIIR
jgi:hypothetical protein